MGIGTIKTTVAKTGQVEQKWYHIDATDRVLGRLSSKIATVLMGKHRPIYTPHVDTGDYIVVTNVENIKITGNKLDERVYASYSYYPGGYKEISMRRMFAKRPERVLEEAVRRMLPKSALGRRMLKKLKIYRGESHPHSAQQPVPWDL
ncbi:MAG: 50S ribosomal protein L13 [Phycisphaerae bacterium]